MSIVKISDITTNLDNRRKPLNGEDRNKISIEKKYPYCGANNIMDFVDDYLFDEEILCIAEDGGKWGLDETCSYIMNEKCWVNNHAHVIKVNNKNSTDIRYLKYWLNHKDLNKLITGAIVKKLTQKSLNNIEIDMPSIDEQRKVCSKLDSIQDLIDIKKDQINKLNDLIKSQFVGMFTNKNYSSVKLKNISKVISGGTPNRSNSEYWNDGTINWVKTTELKNTYIDVAEEKITENGLNNSSAKIVPKDTILLAMYGQGKTRGMTGYLNVEASTNQACACIICDNTVNKKYIWNYLIMSYDELRDMAKGGNQPNLNLDMIKNFEIILPPIELQNKFAQIVDQIDKKKFEFEKSLKKLEELQASLMQEYFE